MNRLSVGSKYKCDYWLCTVFRIRDGFQNEVTVGGGGVFLKTAFEKNFPEIFTILKIDLL